MSDDVYSTRQRELVDALDEAGFYLDALAEVPMAIDAETGKTYPGAGALIVAWLADGKGSVSAIVADCVRAAESKS